MSKSHTLYSPKRMNRLSASVHNILSVGPVRACASSTVKFETTFEPAYTFDLAESESDPVVGPVDSTILLPIFLFLVFIDLILNLI